jgi:hypothetical protein
VAYLVFSEGLIVDLYININTDSRTAFKLHVKHVDSVFYLYQSVCKNTITEKCVNPSIRQQLTGNQFIDFLIASLHDEISFALQEDFLVYRLPQ